MIERNARHVAEPTRARWRRGRRRNARPRRFDGCALRRGRSRRRKRAWRRGRRRRGFGGFGRRRFVFLFGLLAVGHLPRVERLVPILLVPLVDLGKRAFPIVVAHVTPMPSLPRSS